MGMGTNNS